MEFLPVKRALLSVTDKTGLEAFAGFLVSHGVELVSTGGTRKKLLEAGLEVASVSEVTGFPEIMGGRIKTLHPFIHGGILADKDNPQHLKTLNELQIRTFDLICVNLYDFATATKNRLPLHQAIEQIDIGGPTMLRAAAKNFHSILVAPDPQYYQQIIQTLQDNQLKAPLELRKKMATLTFTQTGKYDQAITEYFKQSG